MSWINDVRHDISKLDLTVKSLKKFGLTVGIVLLLLFLWFLFRDRFPAFRLILGAFGLFLIIAGFLFPARLKGLYKIWMGIAFVLGWLVSRIILTVLFFLVLLPVGMLAKIFGKSFLELKMKDGSDSYWIRRETSKSNYEKMF